MNHLSVETRVGGPRSRPSANSSDSTAFPRNILTWEEKCNNMYVLQQLFLGPPLETHRRNDSCFSWLHVGTADADVDLWGLVVAVVD